MSSLQDGGVLCKMVNKFKPGKIPVFNEVSETARKCRGYGLQWGRHGDSVVHLPFSQRTSD